MTITKGPEQRDLYGMLALMAVTAALAAQIVWTVWQLMRAGFAFDVLWRPLAFTTVFLLVAVTRGTVRFINALGRVTIASDWRSGTGLIIFRDSFDMPDVCCRSCRRRLFRSWP
jgi:hypothetical protein